MEQQQSILYQVFLKAGCILVHALGQNSVFCMDKIISFKHKVKTQCFCKFLSLVFNWIGSIGCNSLAMS